MLFAILLRLVAGCPSSCAVCAKEITFCHQLTYIVAAPVTTRVLIVTDGYLASVESTNLSLLLNLALLSLGRNGIEGVHEGALHSLTKLRTLLLEHNRISSRSLPDHTFSQLHSLQVLVLSNNALDTLRGSWFRNARALTRLQLNGNQITNLTDSSFGDTHLPNLRRLDLSNNFISYIEKDAFRSLSRLQEVDLSRNRLAHMPDVFTPLKQLILLSLDENQWSCTCDLHPLARFLRNYVNSSARTLRNAKDLNCQPPPSTAAAVNSVLGLSEANCGSKTPNFSLVLKDRSPIHPWKDVTLLTVLGFAGAVGLTCLGLVVLNWKLQKSKVNEHTSENLSCRTFDESLCAHEARNHPTKGYCNCHLTQENEVKVMSIVGSRKAMPFLQENSHQATVTTESKALDGSFRNLKGMDHGADSTFFCPNGRLLQSGCIKSPEDMAAFNEAGFLTKYSAKRVKKQKNCEPGEVQSQTLPQRVARTIDISSDTFSRRYATSASALARESLEKHLTNESWQPPIEKEDNGLQPHRQRHFITSSSSKPCEPEEHYVQKILQKHRSKYDDPCGLLKWNRPGYLQPSNSLICKYVPCDQFQDYVKEKKPHCRDHSKPEKQQIQINSAIEKFLTSEDNIELSRLSAKTKKTYSPKRVSFHDPDLAEKNRLVMSPKAATLKEQKNQTKQWNNLDLKKCSNPWEKNAARKWLIDRQLLKKKRINRSDLKGKIKGQNVRIKLNLHPFRKVRVHPEKPFAELTNKCKHALLPPKKPKASQKEATINLVSSADFAQQLDYDSSARLTSKKLPLKHARKQALSSKRNASSTTLPCATDTSVVSQSSVEGKWLPPGHSSDRNLSMLSQPTPTIAEHRHSHSQFSSEQIEESDLRNETQTKNNPEIMKTNSISYQNRTELPKDISTSFRNQAIWHLTNSSEKGIDSPNVSLRDGSTEALELKIGREQENEMPYDGNTSLSMLTQTTQVTSKGTTEEKQKTWGRGKSEKQIFYDSSSTKATLRSKDMNIMDSHENENQLFHSGVNLQISNNGHDLRDIKNIQSDKGNGVHKEGEMTVGKHEALSPLPELKGISFEAENEVPLIPGRINEAENSAPKPALPPSAEYANTSPLEAEQSEQNNSNNNDFLL
ncbi:LOW QUALITY PROTEIN: leucine-rich repeat-containing protein 53 [Rhynchocyon petersi]